MTRYTYSYACLYVTIQYLLQEMRGAQNVQRGSMTTEHVEVIE